jgi:membrane protein
MIWLYLSWLILLMGSVIVFHIQYPRYLRYTKRRPHLSIQCQERLAILLMALIGQQHLKGGEVLTLKHLADAVNVPWEAVADILQCLQQSDLLMSLAGDSRFVLAHDTDAILLRDIVQAIRSAGDQPKISATQIEASAAMQTLLQDMGRHSIEFLQDRSLRDILLDPNGKET